MKYFTPELILAGQSDDASVLNEAERNWDATCERYRAYFETIQAELPPGLRRMADSYYLHDARVHGMGQRNGAFVFMLQLDTPPRSLLSFTYRLLDEPIILKKESAVPSMGDSVVEWQHDEIEKIGPNAWSQSILLSNGWEVRLKFSDVDIEEMSAILPVPHGVPASTLSKTA